MLPVVTFEARILQTRIIDSPATVGYGASYRVAPPAKCATVSIGYADGYLRSLTGKGHVYVHGEKCPVIGRVSMDSIVIDITRIKAEIAPGDAVEILGAQRLVDDAAAEAGTIGYEILTGLGRRTPRQYIGGHTASEG
jgi:alanine racemase